MSKSTTAMAVLFYASFIVFSVKVKMDVAQLEAFESFKTHLPRGEAPPPFELPDVEGVSFTLDQQVEEGSLVLINFWATWCPPCRLELPMLDKLHERYREQGLRIVAIDVGEDRTTVGSFLDEHPVSFPVLLDTEQAVASRYRVEAFPTTVLLDDEGLVINVTEGLDPYLSYRIEAFLQRPETETESEVDESEEF